MRTAEGQYEPSTAPPAGEGPDAILAALDPEQREVALAGRGPVCVLAGAGTGKTGTLVARAAWLRAQGVLIALVSNCADSTRGLLEHLGVIPLVDAVVLSCEIGSMKPSPEIYVTALADLGVAAADAVFIDDQPTFCLGAESVGVRPIRIARAGVDGVTAGAGWDFPVVRSFADVPPLLGLPG